MSRMLVAGGLHALCRAWTEALASSGNSRENERELTAVSALQQLAVCTRAMEPQGF